MNLPAPGKPLRSILCVDDEEDILDVACMALEMLGDYEVSRCDSGRQALERISSIKPDLVLMDVMMPEIDGPTAMQRLHAMPEFASLPVVFMTAHVQPERQRVLLDKGAAGCISKPFDPGNLSETVEAIWHGVQNGAADERR